MANITVDDKVECLSRELQFRRYVYAKRVASHKMTQQKADREIAVMECILNDYKKSAGKMDSPEPELQFADDDR